MKNTSVRTTLLAALGLFLMMLLIGAGSGIVALTRANQSTLHVHQVATRVIGINDVYKDTARTRSALVRAHLSLTKDDQETKNAALKSAQTSYDRALKQLADFRAAPPFEGQDPELNAALAEAGARLCGSLDRAITALRNNDGDGYTAINIKNLTSEGASFSTFLERFQKLAGSLANGMVAEREQEYNMVTWLVLAGLALAAAGVVAAHVMLKRTVTTPLTQAVELLDKVARGDLSVAIGAQGSNEIGRLFGAIDGMQQGLKQTVSEVRVGADATMEELVASVSRVTGIVHEIAEASREQSEGIGQVNQAIVQMDGGTQQNAALVEEAAAAAQALQFQAERLAETVSIFKLGEAQGARQPAARPSRQVPAQPTLAAA